MKVEQVINCSFDKWYYLFENITFKSVIIPIPDDVLNYLRSDSTIILPKSCQEELDLEQKLIKKEKKLNFDSDDSWSDDENNEENYPDFTEFDNKIKDAMNIFSKKVFIKLNWSSPKDAYWSLNKLSCERLSDVYMLLKSSDFINHDLNKPFQNCTDLNDMKSEIENFQYNLIIREWIKINPSLEFRCFVNRNKLIGISQRDCRSYYQILIDNKQEYLDRILKFYIDKIHMKFFDSSFVFDVCLGKKSVKLLDFNPYGDNTDSLLYSWEELKDKQLFEDSYDFKSNRLELRLVETDIGVQSNQYTMYSLSIDALDKNQLDLNDFDNITNLIEKNIELQSKEDSSS